MLDNWPKLGVIAPNIFNFKISIKCCPFNISNMVVACTDGVLTAFIVCDEYYWLIINSTYYYVFIGRQQ